MALDRRTKKIILVVLVLLLILCLLLWLLPFASEAERMFQGIGIADVIAIVALIIDLLKPRDLPLLQLRTPAEEMEARLTDRGKRAWVPRTEHPAAWLRHHPRAVLLGPTGGGKTREALEIARAAMQAGGEFPRLAPKLLIPSHETCFEACTRADLERAFQALSLSNRSIILWLDDCHEWLCREEYRRSLDTLIHLIEEASARYSRSHLFILATARPDHTDEGAWEWLDKQELAKEELGPPDSAPMARVIAEAYGIRLGDESRALLAAASDKRPALLDMALHQLAREAHVGPDAEQAKRLSQLLPLSTQELWRRYDRKELCLTPGVETLLKTLALFHRAGVHPFESMVEAYARRAMDVSWPLSIGRQREARRALLSHRYFRISDIVWQVPDYVLEAEEDLPAREEALQALGQFVQAYRRLLHRPHLRRLHRGRAQQAWLATQVGVHLGSQGKHQSAIRSHDLAIKLSPQFALVHYNRGTTYGRLGQRSLAMRDFNRAIELQPKFAPAYCNRGILHGESGQLSKAIRDFDDAIELNPEFASAYCNRGNAYAELGQLPQAVQDFSRAIELNSQDTIAYYNRGNAYASLGQNQRAIQDYSDVIELDRRFAAAYTNRDILYEQSGSHHRAIQDLDDAIRLAPEDIRAWNGRGLAYAGLGQFDRAIRDYDCALDIDPDYILARHNRGMSLIQVDRPTLAIQDFDQVIEGDANFVPAYIWRGIAYANRGCYRQALQDFSRSIDLQPQEAGLFYNRAKAQAQLGNTQAACRDLATYLAKAPAGEFADEACQLMAELDCPQPDGD